MAGPAPRWAGSCTGSWALPATLLVAIVAIIGIVVTIGEVPGAAAAPAFALVVTTPTVLAFRRIDVVVDDEALTVRYGVPHTRRVPLAGVESVEVVDDLRPMQWGGWGYRGGLRVFKYAGIILRRGPAVQLHLTGGRRLVITVDDAAGCAAAVEAALP